MNKIILTFFAVIAALTSTSYNSVASANTTNGSGVFETAYSIVSDRTRSVHGNDVARKFSQLLLIQDLQPVSDLEINEIRVNANVNRLTLSTPLRELTGYSFQISMVRTWESSTTVAEHFVQKAMSSGLLKTQNLSISRN